MRRLKRCLAAAFCLLLMLGALSLSAFADDANVKYVGNAKKFFFSPGSEFSLTDLFPNFKDVMPGDSLTQKITVTNDISNNVKIKVYMRSYGATDESYVEFLDQLRLTVTKAEETVLFDAAADKTDGLTEWTYLGTLYSGGTVDLNVTLEVPTTLDNMFKKLYGEIEWEFAVEELPVSPDDPKPPKTGDDFMLWLWILLLVLSAAGIYVSSRYLGGGKKKRVKH